MPNDNTQVGWVWSYEPYLSASVDQKMVFIYFSALYFCELMYTSIAQCDKLLGIPKIMTLLFNLCH